MHYPRELAPDAYEGLAAPIEGRTIRLVPLAEHHAEKLRVAFADSDLWGWSLVSQPPPTTREGAAAWLRDAFAQAHARTQVPLAIETLGGELAGTTRYLDLRWFDGGVEIGHTMVFAPFRRTHVNTEAKYLLLRRAFDEVRVARVALKTDARNQRSRAAIARIGAKFEGILRCYQRRYNEEIRDTAFFSITFQEWPAVRAALEARLDRTPSW